MIRVDAVLAAAQMIDRKRESENGFISPDYLMGVVDSVEAMAQKSMLGRIDPESWSELSKAVGRAKW